MDKRMVPMATQQLAQLSQVVKARKKMKLSRNPALPARAILQARKPPEVNTLLRAAPIRSSPAKLP
jgi:hypothetical protein